MGDEGNRNLIWSGPEGFGRFRKGWEFDFKGRFLGEKLLKSFKSMVSRFHNNNFGRGTRGTKIGFSRN